MMPLLQRLLAHPAYVFLAYVLSWDVAGVFKADAVLYYGQFTNT